MPANNNSVAPVKKAVLAYSGGLDTSIIIPWLKEHYNCEVVAYCSDVGQGSELNGLREKALKSGASKVYIEDLRKEFLEDYIYPMMQAGALYEGKYLLGTSIARPLIARKMMDVVESEGADAVAHGCTGKGNDQVRFELTFKAFDPTIRVIAPWREWSIKSREDALRYAAEHHIPVPVSTGNIYSHDKNLWHLSSEGGCLEDPWNEPPKELFELTVAPEDAPDKAESVEISFVSGRPAKLNGRNLDPVALITELNTIGGKHGIGRTDIVENRLVGMKSRGVYETPGGTILYAAHKELESLVLDASTMHFKESLAPKYAELVYNGLWFTPLREALDAFVKETQKNITGDVKLKLYKGNCTVTGRKSPYSLYREELASFGKMDVYDQKDAEGFINLYGLSVKVRTLIEMEGGEQLKGYQAPNYSKFKRD
ncbi:MAG: argininosuccinate synthase [Deltaproteobacteria bacterium]|nr:argininosuccinate synthase [Deltaproteobacteria bacterium]MBI2341863.1 argininosuccinate synthase [Deltaproteobacteria bacterium]